VAGWWPRLGMRIIRNWWYWPKTVAGLIVVSWGIASLFRWLGNTVGQR